ncbi:MAG TPA: carbohydrate ABC transporter permease [Candidatus Ornithomonoglobus intestinigallinarum]|uniref:Carbohydrate ABC transporter permease n=1 Tax=Candidatus Ornithomonoglobus intestinigallinarum TaxID=2840894 RepID=A0A9D1H3I3_9FIRM|nr:carbohydrate ABC transporter permease [Candidatus Ornithomonoglobus intestinigallinarum]
MKKKEIKSRTGIISDIDYKQPFGKTLYWLLFAVMIIIAFVAMAPPAWVMMSSVKNIKEFYQIPPTLLPHSFDWGKIAEAWQTLDFTRYYANTFIVTIGSIVVRIVFNGLAGYAMSKLKPKGWKVVFGLTLGSMMIPAQVSMIPVYLNIVSLKMINSFVPLILMAGFNAYSAIIFKSFFDGIPSTLTEAAQIDGCSVIGIFFKIIVPLSKPVIATIAIMAFTTAWGDFLMPLLILKDKSLHTIMLAVYTLQGSLPQDQIMVILTFAIIPPAIIFIIFQRNIMQGMTMSGIKG